MLSNYFRVALRNLQRSLSHSVINVFGLSLGLTCALLIYMLVTYHLSFDTFHTNADRIYRFVTEQHRDQVSYVYSVPPAFGNAFRNDYTYAEKVARVCTNQDVLVSIDLKNDKKKFNDDISFVDPEYFDIFNFPTTEGTIPSAANTAALTEDMAIKYFGNESPIGKTIRLDNRVDFQVTGVIKNIPDNTDFRSKIFLSYASMKQYNEWYADENAWGGITTDIQTFARLHPGVAPKEVENVLPAYVKKYRAESKNVHHYKLQPLNDVHFNALYNGQMSM
ncbi:MAG: ABC transporter permease [Chryseolinea sp.]